MASVSHRLPRDVRHAIRNDLHAIRLGLHLYKEQMQLGMLADAQSTFDNIESALRSLNENEALSPHPTRQSQNEPAD